MTALDIAEKFIKKHEGYRKKVYLCPSGKLTVGWGTNLEALGLADGVSVGDEPYTREELQEFLTKKLNYLISFLRKYIKVWDALTDIRKAVLIDMAYNLGPSRFMKFKKMLAAIEEEEYEDAAIEMQDSKWATQVGRRATELIQVWVSNKLPIWF